MRSPESSDIERQMTVREPENHAERDLTPLAQVFSPKFSSAVSGQKDTSNLWLSLDCRQPLLQ
jgi:hypothetical protein